MKVQEIQEQVRTRYAAAAEAFDGNGQVFAAGVYGAGGTDEVPEEAALASLGCGNPVAVVDVVISSCVVNLSGDKPRVLGEMFRVLAPGGRIGISDGVAEDHLTEADRAAGARSPAASPAAARE